MQLFALVAHSENKSKDGRKVVEEYLSKLLNQSQAEQYISLFEDFLAAHYKGSDEKRERKQFAANSVKILKICTIINEELTHPQKLIVLIRLIEFLKANGNLDNMAYEFAETVSDTFNIDKKEFLLCYGLLENDHKKLNNNQLLLIGNKPLGLENARIWPKEVEFEGTISIIRIASAELYFLIYKNIEGVELNGQAISPNAIFTLSIGAILKVPQMGSIYFSDINAKFLSDKRESEVVYNIDQIEYTFKNGVKAMHKFSFETGSGKMCGIMGGSGAGKSTLLHLLNGSQKPEKGNILINGVDLYDKSADVKKLIGFVSQDDLLMDDLTVLENLWYSAKLSFDDLSNEDIKKKVDGLLVALGLYEVRDLKVGNPLEKYISGGQRKRLNIALEMIREPEILFVDEPTSGLSSRDSERIMELLKNMALNGKLVFVVIHQPSSNIFKMFDQLIILDLGGYPIYQGNPMEAAGYFKSITDQVSALEIECQTCRNVNPEQIFDIIESKVVDEYGRPTQNRKISPKEWYILYKKESKSLNGKKEHKKPLPESKIKKPSKWKQSLVFFSRDLKSKIANKQYLLINLLEAPALALILAFFLKTWKVTEGASYTFYDNNNISAYILICIIAALFIGMTVSAEEIFKDRKIRKREKFLSLSNGSYLFSKVILLFIISAIQSFLFIIIGNFILGIEDMYFAYWLVMFSTICFANLLGLNISSAFNSAVTIYILIPLLIIPQLMLCGIIVRFDQLNPKISSPDRIPLTAEMMASKWAFEALAVHQFTENEYEKQFFEINQQISSSSYYFQFWLDEYRKFIYHYAETSEEEQLKGKKIINEILMSIQKFPKMPSWKADVNADWNKFYDYSIRFEKFLKKYNNKKVQEKDKIIAQEKGEYWHQLKLRKSNEYLEKILKASDKTDKIIKTESKIIQVMDPIYHIPQKSVFAHHFAPVKKIGNYYMKTLYFNVIAIWVMTLCLFVLLYFDGLKKFIKLFG